MSRIIAISRTLLKTRLFGLHFCRWQYGPISNHFYLITPPPPQTAEFGRITQNNDHDAVQGHSRSLILVPIVSQYATSHNCRSLIKFALSTGVPLFNTYSFGWTPKLRITNFGLKKLESSLYRIMQKVFQHLELFRSGSRVWQRDRRTDRQTDGQNRC